MQTVRALIEKLLIFNARTAHLWTITDWIPIVRSLLLYLHLCMHAIICRTVLRKCSLFCICASIAGHIMCHTVYIVTAAHMHVFMSLLNSLLFKRTPKIWIWIWALRWLMKPSRHWKRATHSPAADEILITGHRKRFIWASHGPWRSL